MTAVRNAGYPKNNEMPENLSPITKKSDLLEVVEFLSGTPSISLISQVQNEWARQVQQALFWMTM